MVEGDLVGPFACRPGVVASEDRIKALREAGRIARPGGVVAAAAISRFASLFDGLACGFLFDPDFVNVVSEDLATGQHRNPEDRPHWFTTAFFHHPSQLSHEVAEAGLNMCEFVGVEGLAAYLPQLAQRWDDSSDRGTILWAARSVESEPSLLGLSPHLLLVAAAP